MKKILLALLMLVALLPAKGAGVGEWTPYLSYQEANYNITINNAIYVLYNGNLLEYLPETAEVKMLSKIDGLSDRNILYMRRAENRLVLLYDNGNIDIYNTISGTVKNLPQIKSSTNGNISIRSLNVCGDQALVTTTEGIIQVDLKNDIVKGFYDLNRNIISAAIFDGCMYAAGDEDIWVCRMSGNLYDTEQWMVYRHAPAAQFMLFGDGMYVTMYWRGHEGALQQGLWWMSAAGSEVANKPFEHLTYNYYDHISSNGTKAVMFNAEKIAVYSSSAPKQAERELQQANTFNHLELASDGTFWASCGTSGLMPYKLSTNGILENDGTAIGKYGPRRDLCYYMAYTGDKLLIAGGRLDPYDREHHVATPMILENGKWTFFQEENMVQITGTRYRDATCLVMDPADTSRYYMSTAGSGLFEFKDYKYVKNYGLNNSPLQTADRSSMSPNYVRVDGLAFDRDNNLWMADNWTGDSVIRVLKTDGTWKTFFIDNEVKRAPTMQKTLFDSKGRFWLCSRRTVNFHDGGLLCLDYGGTLDDEDDDISTYRTHFTNEDGKTYKLNGVFDIAFDQDSTLWVGTNVGLFVITDPDRWFDSDFTVLQVKVPRNDGTNFADYLLDGVNVMAVAVDAANRKWLGTTGVGVYVVSPDGTEILHHFTAENSPLLSNNIYSIAPNLKTGEVFIGTDKGLISYQSEASQPNPTLSKDMIKVFPNPVRPEYTGNLTVMGLTADADIKVTTSTGQVVAAGRSTGGTFVWDCRNKRGQRVATGVYYIMVSTADGKNGVAAKVVVI